MQAALVLLDKWEAAGFLVMPPRFSKVRHTLLRERWVPSWRSAGEAIIPHHPPSDSVVEVTLGSYNNQWWFPVEPYL